METLMAFPPLKGNKSNPPQPVHVVESGAFSTGKGGLKVSKALKNRGTVPSPGVEKTNSAS